MIWVKRAITHAPPQISWSVLQRNKEDKSKNKTQINQNQKQKEELPSDVQKGRGQMLPPEEFLAIFPNDYLSLGHLLVRLSEDRLL